MMTESEMSVHAELDKLFLGSAWRKDKWGRWTLGDRRFRVTSMVLRYELCIRAAGRWVRARSWYHGQINWVAVQQCREAAERMSAALVDGHKPNQEKARGPRPVSNGPVTTIVTENEERNGIEVKFSDKPSDEIRQSMRDQGFRFSSRQGLWWARRTPARLAFAKSLTSEVAEVPA